MLDLIFEALFWIFIEIICYFFLGAGGALIRQAFSKKKMSFKEIYLKQIVINAFIGAFVFGAIAISIIILFG